MWHGQETGHNGVVTGHKCQARGFAPAVGTAGNVCNRQSASNGAAGRLYSNSAGPLDDFVNDDAVTGLAPGVRSRLEMQVAVGSGDGGNNLRIAGDRVRDDDSGTG